MLKKNLNPKKPEIEPVPDLPTIPASPPEIKPHPDITKPEQPWPDINPFVPGPEIAPVKDS